MLNIGIVAGEVSGDMLGAGLVYSLNKTIANLTVKGIGGEKLIAAGMNVLYPMDTLSVMGITEVFGRYWKLRKIRSALRDYFISNPPDIFIGIDAPDFNLWLEKELHDAGITTVHYVSPSVWAWREYRIKKITKAVDLILNLFPFEAEIYDKYQVQNHYVGHPLADKLANHPDQLTARDELGLPSDKTIVAILPGSRLSEINKIAAPLIQAAELAPHGLYFISGFANEATLKKFKEMKAKLAPSLGIDLYLNKTHHVMAAADVLLLVSGTATLEAMLLKKPMVVVYRLSWITYAIVKMMVQIPYAALPNILAGEKIVPECLQSDCTPAIIVSELNKILNSEDKMAILSRRFSELSKQLRKNADQQAANAVLALMEKRNRVC